METLKVICPECMSVNTINKEEVNLSPKCEECNEDLNDPFPVEVDDESCLKHISQSDVPILLDFYSPICGPCMAMYDDYEDAALSFPLQVKFLKINVDKHQKVAKEYGLSSVPAIIAFKNGEEVSRINSTLSLVELDMWAKSLI